MTPFDPFALAARRVPERALHLGIRGAMSLVCLAFLARRAAEFSEYLLKPLWLAETLLYFALVAAYLTRTDPVERSRGAAEILLPGVAALLPFFLLLSPPSPWASARPALPRTLFWAMAASTAFTVWGLWALRRSFSITVEARGLVTRGPYRWVRHPVYLGEMGAAAAVALWRASAVNTLLLAAFVALQMVRARMEEAKLARCLPQWAGWAAGTWWFWKAGRP